MAHTCSTALIKCMDFRLTRDVESWLSDNNLTNDCDIISIAGAAKELVENPNGFVFSQVELSINLHRAKKVFIMYHMDCGAYGGSAAFAGDKEEEAKYMDEMNKARDIISAKFPEIEILLTMAYIEDGGWRIEAV
jgi:carbonic anhydrase